MEGEYDVVASADRVVRVRFRAFANVPLPGLFASHIVVVPAADDLGGLSDPPVGAPA